MQSATSLRFLESNYTSIAYYFVTKLSDWRGFLQEIMVKANNEDPTKISPEDANQLTQKVVGKVSSYLRNLRNIKEKCLQ